MVECPWALALGLLLAALGHAGTAPVDSVADVQTEMGQSVERPATQVCSCMPLHWLEDDSG